MLNFNRTLISMMSEPMLEEADMKIREELIDDMILRRYSAADIKRRVAYMQIDGKYNNN